MESAIHFVEAIALARDLNQLMTRFGFFHFHDLQIELLGELFDLSKRTIPDSCVES